MARTAFQLTFDQKARAAYLKFSSAPVAETIEAANGLLVDLDHRGELVGVEILTAGTLRLLLQTTPELRAHHVPALEPSQVEEIERLFERMSA
jgi:uncharacterized protein YuzE